MEFQLYLFDIEKKVDIPIPSAEVVIGRDSFLQCDDKRISRQHGIIKLNADQTTGETRAVQITSTHTNPIFIRTEDNVLNILTKDLTATLRQGEKFALLPDQYWYEVRFRGADSQPSSSVVSSTLRVRTMEEVNNDVVVGTERVLPNWMELAGEKRKNVDESEAESSKKSKTEDSPATEAVVSSVVCTNDPIAGASNSPDVTDSSEAQAAAIKPDPDAGEASSSRPKSPLPAASGVTVKKESPDSTGPPPRPSCEFGIRCYRHNIEHRSQFAHPNDADYRRPNFPQAPDDAPHCPFGVSCYRRNPQHFREYQHPDSSEYKASVAPVIQVPVNPPAPQPQNNANTDGVQRRRRHQRLARDIIMAAIANDVLFDGEDDDDDDDDLGEELDFDADDSDDEYVPGAESDGEDADDNLEEGDTQELNGGEDEE